MSGRRTGEVDAEERVADFHAGFDDPIDAGLTLADLVEAAGDYLGMILGRAPVDAAMARLVAPLAGKPARPEEWRERLRDQAGNCFSEWPMGQQLHDLAAYAHYGVALTEGERDGDEAAWIEARVEEAARFLERSPIHQWLGPDRAPQLERLVLLAEARWALDNHRSVKPAAVAEFGGISAPRMRNLMAGADRVFHRDAEGLIPAHEALAWLAGREGFRSSVWRNQSLPRHGLRDRPPLEAPVFVPVARDGSIFHPGLERSGTYTIGEKGDETHVEGFDEALRALQAMPAPRWRRPNEKGAWGLVRGVRWERLDRDELKGFAENPGQRLPALPGEDRHRTDEEEAAG